MNKQNILFFILFLLFLSQIKIIREGFIDTSNKIKEEIIYFSESFIHFYKAHFKQAKTIEELRERNFALEKNLSNYIAKYNHCKDLKYFNYIESPNLEFIKVISYVSLPDFTSVYVNYSKKLTKSKGIIYNNMAAGVVAKNIGHYSIAYLNSNPKAIYTVFIGENKIPGIFYGKEKTIKYIPKLKKINVGDTVITSGLDKVFYEGAKVGIITSIKENKLYQEATIKTFFNDLNPKYFYVVDLEKK